VTIRGAAHSLQPLRFIDCPFSPDYQPIFRAILFAAYAREFRPRSAWEISDSSQNRLAKIIAIIREPKFGIHDLSMMEIDPRTKLPRFNMPFELGLFLAAKSFGAGQQARKVAPILDHDGYRYRDALSDISGQDIAAHGGNAEKAIHEVRHWLDSGRAHASSLPGGAYITTKYLAFHRNLPLASERQKLDASTLTYADLCRAMESWLRDNARGSGAKPHLTPIFAPDAVALSATIIDFFPIIW
jgi:hypothetical protein